MNEDNLNQNTNTNTNTNGTPLEPVTNNNQPQVQPQVQPEVQPEVQPQVQPEIQPQVQPEVQPEVQPQVQLEIQPQVQSPEPPSQSVNGSEKKPNNNMLLIIIGGVVILALILVVVLVFFGKNNTNNQGNNNQNSVTTTDTTNTENTTTTKSSTNTGNNSSSSSSSEAKAVKFNEYGEIADGVMLKINGTESVSSLGHENIDELHINATVKNNSGSDILVIPANSSEYSLGDPANKGIFDDNPWLLYIPAGVDEKNITGTEVKNLWAFVARPESVSLDEQVKLKDGEEMDVMFRVKINGFDSSWGVDIKPYAFYFQTPDVYFQVK